MKFGLVGASGALLNLGFFSLLTIVLQVHYLAAGLLSIELALCSNYLLNNTWTFFDRSGGRANWPGLARYQVVGAGGTLINLGVLHFFAGRLGVPPILANVLGISTATAWNFALSLGWAWRPRLNVISTQG